MATEEESLFQKVISWILRHVRIRSRDLNEDEGVRSDAKPKPAVEVEVFWKF